MRKFKKALAFALASAMIVSAAPVSAATTNSAKGTKSTIYTYTVDKSKKGNANNKRSWIKVTTKKGYTYKLVNKTTDIVSLTKTRVEAKKAGTAKINVNFYKNGKYVETKSVKITVKKAQMIGTVSLSKDTVNVGETATVSNAGKGTAYFYSSNKDVATVDKESGEITAKAAGTTTISAVNTITKARVYLTLTVVADAPVATQTGANTITVTNGVEMDATGLTLKKGSTTISTKSVETSADKKTITITASSKLTEGTYTVAFGDKTLDVTAATEKVDAIKILSEKAASSSDYKSATVGYQVLNQFGEDITSDVSTIQASGTNNPTIADGKVTFTAVSGSTYIPNRDVVSLVLLDTNTGKSAQATLTVSDASAVSDLTYGGIYNANGTALTEDSDPTEYYALFTAKDQYGNDMTSDIEVGTNLFLTLASGSTNLTLSNKTKTITVNGTKYMGVRLAYASSTEQLTLGTATLTAIAAGNGKSVTENVEVAAGATIANFSITNPGTVAKGEEVTLDYTALDRNGNAITSYDQLKKMKISTSTNSAKVEVRKTSGNKGELVFTYTGEVTSSTVVILTFTTPTYSMSTAQITVKEQATPAKISEAKEETVTTTTKSNNKVTAEDLVIIDSYGREVSSSNIETVFGADYSIKVDPTQAVADGIKINVADSEIKTETEVTGIKYGKEIFTVVGTGSEVGESTVTLTIYKGATKVSSVEIPVKVTEVTNVTSVATSIGTVYVPVNETEEFAQSATVTGKSNGVSVTLVEGTDYTLTALTSNIKVDGNKVYAVDRANISALDNNDTTTGKVRVTLASGVSYDTDVTLTKVAPTVKAVNLTKTSFTVASGSSVNVSGSNIAVGADDIVKSVVDSNSVYHTDFSANKVAGLFAPTVTTDDTDNVAYDLATGKYTITGSKGDQVTFTITYGNVSKVIRVTVE